MKHDDYKKLIYLVITDELSEKEKRLIHDHTEECSECRNEYEKLEKLKKLPLKESFIKPEMTMLEWSRVELLNKINQRKIKVSIIPVVINFLRYLFMVEKRTVLVGSLMLAFGLFVGFIIAGRTPDIGYVQNMMGNSAFLVNQPQINNLKFINSNNSNENVDFTFDEVVTFRMNGNINESRVQKILALALTNEQNPGVRLKTVSTFNNKKTDKVMKDAIIQAVKNDDNPGVRKEAIQVLANLPFDEDIRDALICVLQNDKNSGLRNAALKCIERCQYLDKNYDKRIYNTLKTKMENDENSFIKYRAKTLLEEVEK